MAFRYEAEGSLFEFINTSLKHKVKADKLELFHVKVKWISCNYRVKSEMCTEGETSGRRAELITYVSHSSTALNSFVTLNLVHGF